MKLEHVDRHARRAAGPGRVDARIPPGSDPFLARIDALQERLRAVVAACRSVFGLRERSPH